MTQNGAGVSSAGYRSKHRSGKALFCRRQTTLLEEAFCRVEPLHYATDRAESADADIEMIRRKAFPGHSTTTGS